MMPSVSQTEKSMEHDDRTQPCDHTREQEIDRLTKPRVTSANGPSAQAGGMGQPRHSEPHNAWQAGTCGRGEDGWAPGWLAHSFMLDISLLLW